MGVGGQRHFSVALPPERAAVPIVRAVGWTQGPVRLAAKKTFLAPTTGVKFNRPECVNRNSYTETGSIHSGFSPQGIETETN